MNSSVVEARWDLIFVIQWQENLQKQDCHGVKTLLQDSIYACG